MNRTTPGRPLQVERAWHVGDAADMPGGRLAGQGARSLRGTHKPDFSYAHDGGDFVIVINADKAVWTGRKEEELIYWHTGWPGGLRSVSRGDLLEKNPVRMIEKSVWGMLPKNKIGRHMVARLKVYAGPEHPHEANQPKPLAIRKEKN